MAAVVGYRSLGFRSLGPTLRSGRNSGVLRAAIAVAVLWCALTPPPALLAQRATRGAESSTTGSGYAALSSLFDEWRRFEVPPTRDGAPDYTAGTFAIRHRELAKLQSRLAAIDPKGWPVEQQVDYHLVRAEMNGMDFNIRVLRPWARDPAYYASVWSDQSDTPAHEGPTHHALVEVWQYQFPLNTAAQAKMAKELRMVAPLLTQARANLVGNAQELWEAGIANLRGQTAALDDLRQRTRGASGDLHSAIDSARTATQSFVTWLEAEAPKKTGPSGIGEENYTWYLRNVHLRPYSWEQEVTLLERELARAHTSLRLEEHRNRNLPQLVAIKDPEEYERRANEAATKYLDFLAKNNVLEIHDFMDPALRARLGSFTPEDQRNFFAIAIHYEPMTLWTHFYHWWDLARMAEQPHPSPIRRGPMLYNIFDSRAEGMSTSVEEKMMHAGLYDDNPRVREIVWIMLAQRAARGLGSLYVHANEMTMKEARDFHVRWTPRGWMREDLDLLGFEQLLYLRQPGYGSSYITGKIELEELMAERAHQLGDDFSLRRFFAEVDAAGVIPVSMIRLQLTGQAGGIMGRSDAKMLTATSPLEP